METASKIAFGIGCLLTTLIGFILCYGLIYYEKNLNDRYRTLINELYTLILHYIMINLGFINMIIVIRLFMEISVPIFICYGLNFIIAFSIISMCLTLNEATFIQYLYGCYFKTVGVLDEQFLFYFLNVVNMFVAGYVSVYIIYGNMNVPTGFAHCVNMDRDLVFQPRIYDSKIPYFFYIIGITILWHLVLRFSIRKAKNKVHKYNQRQNQVVGELISYWSVLIFVVAFGMANLAMEVKDQDGPPIVMPRIITNVALGWGLPAHSFFKHKKIRNFFKRGNEQDHIIVV